MCPSELMSSLSSFPANEHAFIKSHSPSPINERAFLLEAHSSSPIPELSTMEPYTPFLASVFPTKEDSTQTVKSFSSLLTTGFLSDFRITVCGRDYPVHRAILGARSDVFAAIFQNDCKESREGKMEITDLNQGVFEQMLNYIYTGEVQNMDNFSVGLFVAADKYQLPGLKSMCEDNIALSLTMETVSQVLRLSDYYGSPRLREYCLQFMVDNHIHMTKELWQVLIPQPEVTYELFRRLSAERKKAEEFSSADSSFLSFDHSLVDESKVEGDEMHFVPS